MARDHVPSQHREVLTVSQEECESARPVPVAATRQAGLGVVVFSPTTRLLYANESARQFLKRLNGTEKDHQTDGVLPLSIDGIFSEILKALEIRAVNGDGELLQVHRLVGGQDKPVVVRAYGLPDQIGMQRSRIVITMQGISSSAIPGGTDI